jgi:hypothetical protein
VSISAVSSNGLWACRYDFIRTHCTFTMTKMPAGFKYWVLYEGTPGGQYDDTDWWMTRHVATQPHDSSSTRAGDSPSAGVDRVRRPKLSRVLFLFHHDELIP